jgi:hypothetical protein
MSDGYRTASPRTRPFSVSAIGFYAIKRIGFYAIKSVSSRVRVVST